MELDVPAILEWGREIWPASQGRSGHELKHRSLIAGDLVALDELGVAEIKVPDGFLLVETLGEPPLGCVGEAVELQPPEVHAYPCDL